MGAAAAVAAGLAVTASPTAQAADQWGGIATGQQGQWVLWWGKPDRTSAAYFGNWAKCGAACKRVLLFEECGALAYNGGAFSAAERLHNKMRKVLRLAIFRAAGSLRRGATTEAAGR